MWKEAVVAELEVVSWDSPGKIEEKPPKKSQYWCDSQDSKRKPAEHKSKMSLLEPACYVWLVGDYEDYCNQIFFYSSRYA
jgi:hypothetical protein